MISSTKSTNKDLNINLLKRLMRMNKNEVYNFLSMELSRHFQTIDNNGEVENYLYAKGELPILLVAHLDTVFEPIDFYPKDYYGIGSYYEEEVADNSLKPIYWDRQQGVMWSPEGLGADDRLGVFLIVSLLRRGLKPSVLFTTDEEIGSASGLDFATNYKDSLIDSNIKYLMELDRSGRNDCVFYNCDNREFIKYIESYGFKKDYGSFTDISNICPLVGIAGVNLSIGYFNEHQKIETIDIFTMSKNFDIIYTMVEKSKELKNYFKYIPKKKKKKRKSSVINFEQKPSEEEFEARLGRAGETNQCAFCEKPIKDHLFAEDLGAVCLDCYLDLYEGEIK